MHNEFIKNQASQYSVIISKKGTGFILRVPELGLIKKTTDLNTGYTDLENQKIEFLASMHEIHAEDEIIPPRGGRETLQKKERLKEVLTRYITLAVLIITAGLISGGIGGALIGKSITESMAKIEKKLDHAFTADSHKKAERLDRFKAKVDYLKPYIREIKSAFKDPKVDK